MKNPSNSGVTDSPLKSPRKYLRKYCCLGFSRVRLRATPETAAHQAPLSLGFSSKNTGVGCHLLLQCVKVKVKSLNRVRPSATPWTAAFQAPLSMGFSRQEYWRGVPLPSLLLPQFCPNQLHLSLKVGPHSLGFDQLFAGASNIKVYPRQHEVIV